MSNTSKPQEQGFDVFIIQKPGHPAVVKIRALLQYSILSAEDTRRFAADLIGAATRADELSKKEAQ